MLIQKKQQRVHDGSSVGRSIAGEGQAAHSFQSPTERSLLEWCLGLGFGEGVARELGS